MKNIVVLAGALGAIVSFENPHAATCASFTPGSSEELAIESLRRNGARPLCELIASPRKGDFWMRTTSFVGAGVIVRNIHQKHGKLVVEVEDSAFIPNSSRTFTANVNPAAFVTSLQSAGLDAMWSAPDDPCEVDKGFNSEVGMILEFYGSDGYYARWAPTLQECVTPYREIFIRVTNLLNALE